MKKEAEASRPTTITANHRTLIDPVSQLPEVLSLAAEMLIGCGPCTPTVWRQAVRRVGVFSLLQACGPMTSNCTETSRQLRRAVADLIRIAQSDLPPTEKLGLLCSQSARRSTC